MAHLQAHSLTNFNRILNKAALDSTNSRDIQELLRASGDFGTAILAEAATFTRELLDLMVATQRTVARYTTALPGAMSSSPQTSPDRVADFPPDSPPPLRFPVPLDVELQLQKDWADLVRQWSSGVSFDATRLAAR